MTNGFKLSKFLFNFTDNSEIELNDTDFNIINIIFKKITNSLTQEEENFLNELLGIKKVTTVAEKEEVDTTLFFKYEYINPIPDSLIVTEIDTLFSLLFSLDKYQLFSSNMRVAYYMPTRELIEIRLKFLIDFGIQDPVLVFNKEKKDTENKYNRENKVIIAKDGISTKCVRYIKNKYFLNHHGWTFELIIKNINEYYVNNWLLYIQDKIYNLGGGSAQKGINQNNFLQLNILIPTNEVQEYIVKECDYYDNLIDILKKENERLQNNKIIELLLNSSSSNDVVV